METHPTNVPYTVHRLELLEILVQTSSYVSENQCPYMDSSSFASKLWVAAMARLHTYIDAGP